MPPRVALVGCPSQFTVEQPSLVLAALGLAPWQPSVDLDRWIEAPPLTMVDFPTSGRAYRYRSLSRPERFSTGWWNLHFHTWVWTAALIVVAWVLRKTTWENKLALVLLAAVVLLMYGLRDPRAAAQWIMVARFGLLAGGALWLIQAVFGSGSAAVKKKVSAETPTAGGDAPPEEGRVPPAGGPGTEASSGDGPRPRVEASQTETAGDDKSREQPEKD
ncbi:MAG TPA: hypothetical protein EYP14_05650 [Planctomycetaceae bacterium]|nr:hypothetical protein [Planctomycetaceae bacterium]